MSGDVLWRVPGRGPNGSEGVTVTRRPVQFLNREDGKRFFGGRIKAVRESESDVEIVEGGMRATLTMPRSFAANAAVDDAVCVQVDGDGIHTYTIAEAFPARYIFGEESNPLAVGIVPGICGGVE